MSQLSGNTYYVDVASTGASSCLEAKDIKLRGIIYLSETANQEITLNDIAGTSPAGSPTVGSVKIRIGTNAAHQTVYINLADNPIRFPNGIWISELDGGTASLIVEFK